MSFLKLRSHLKSLRVEEHIIAARKGNSENVKNKIAIPLLQTLGWDLRRDMDFDHLGLDIVLFSQGNPSMIVEVKSWGDRLANEGGTNTMRFVQVADEGIAEGQNQLELG